MKWKDIVSADEYRQLAGLPPKGDEFFDLHKARRSVTKHPATPVRIDGHRFDSKAEGRRYEWLKAHPDVLHIDVHPVFTLSTGRRYMADFLVWYHNPQLENGNPDVEDVKGCVGNKFDSWRIFQRTREDFDSHHPLAPLRVVTWNYSKKEWEEV